MLIVSNQDKTTGDKQMITSSLGGRLKNHGTLMGGRLLLLISLIGINIEQLTPPSEEGRGFGGRGRRSPRGDACQCWTANDRGGMPLLLILDTLTVQAKRLQCMLGIRKYDEIGVHPHFPSCSG